jgi:hypothetical protein
MRSERRGALAAGLFLILYGTAHAGGPPGPLKDWPCEAPYADRLDAAALWPEALPAPLPPDGAWKNDAVARPLVEFIASTENSANAGSRRIADETATHGKLTPAQAMLALSGTVERINTIRDFLLEGIRTQVVRSHILAEAVAENGKSLAAAKAAPSSDPARQPAAIEKARYINLRSLDDAGDGAAMLCHRYAYDEGKARALAAALRENMQ